MIQETAQNKMFAVSLVNGNRALDWGAEYIMPLHKQTTFSN
jgi:hypothetical protein